MQNLLGIIIWLLLLSDPSLTIVSVHFCLDYTLSIDYSHFDFRRLDYKDVWTIPIGLLGRLDYQNLDYTQNTLSFRLHLLRLFWIVLGIFFFKKKALNRPKKTYKDRGGSKKG